MFIVQEHSALTLLTHYEIDTSECAVYKLESDENTQQLYISIFLHRGMSVFTVALVMSKMLFCSTPCFVMTLVSFRLEYLFAYTAIFLFPFFRKLHIKFCTRGTALTFT